MVADEEFGAVGAMVTTDPFKPVGAMVTEDLFMVAAGVLRTVGAIVSKGAVTPALGAAEERNEAFDADTLGATGAFVGARIAVGAGVEGSSTEHSRLGVVRVYCSSLSSITTTAARLLAKLPIVRPHPCHSNSSRLSRSTAALRAKDVFEDRMYPWKSEARPVPCHSSVSSGYKTTHRCILPYIIKYFVHNNDYC